MINIRNVPAYTPSSQLGLDRTFSTVDQNLGIFEKEGCVTLAGAKHEHGGWASEPLP